MQITPARLATELRRPLTDSEKEILSAHARWLSGDPAGRRALFSNADLRGADLRGANLRDAVLYRADLRNADLSGANLRGATFFRADVRGASFRGADIAGADFSATIRDEPSDPYDVTDTYDARRTHAHDNPGLGSGR